MEPGAWDEPVVYTDSQLGCGQIQQGKRVGPTKLIKLHRRAMKLTASLSPSARKIERPKNKVAHRIARIYGNLVKA